METRVRQPDGSMPRLRPGSPRWFRRRDHRRARTGLVRAAGPGLRRRGLASSPRGL